MKKQFLFFLFIVAVAWLPICSVTAQQVQDAPRTVVVWISVDGMRYDYPERTETPFLDRLKKEGSWSTAAVPVFPSLTFPSHVSQATGVKVQEHGISGNSFYDSKTRQLYKFPDDPSLLEAEPIWTTAKRQGVRTAVLDWPLSHKQTGIERADYFGERFDQGLKDEERLEQLFDIWQKDSAAEPLRLVMGYVIGPDKPGHRHGPDAPETLQEVTAVDTALGQFFEKMMALWKERMTERDTLYFIVSTDHGMAKVEHNVNLPVLIGRELPREVEIVTNGNVGFIHLDQLPETRAASLRSSIMEQLKKQPFLRAFTRDELPEQWALQHPTRVGDIVVVLNKGYTLNRQRKEPVYEATDILGMHGYDPVDMPEMNGVLYIWRHPQPLGGRDLGPVNSLQLHPTVARLLGIQPATGATAEPIELDQAGATFPQKPLQPDPIESGGLP